ncbi:MAG TPA: hypothetical protein VGU20_09955 [Stellaceae bacterium]|nr:hypothetical protein [Stellaceae bacterium]
MDWIDITETVAVAGLCVGSAGLVVYLLCVWRRRRIPWRKLRLAKPWRLESKGELWGLAIMFGGLALGQVAIAASDVQLGIAPSRLIRSFAVAAGFVLLWGISIGRLSLRHQLRLEDDDSDAPPSAAT